MPMLHEGSCIADCLIRNAIRFSQKPQFLYLKDGVNVSRTLSFAALEKAAKKVAGMLTSRNVGPGRVLLAYQDTIEFIIAFLGCQYAGAVPVPCYFTKGKKHIPRLIQLYKNAEVSIVLTSTDLLQTVNSALQSDYAINDLQVMATDSAAETDEAPEVRVNADSIAFIQFTSGTTDTAKGVVISNDSLMANQRMIKETFGCNEDSVILSWLPFNHDMGLVGNLLHAVYVGCTCIIMDSLQFIQHPANWLQAISTYQVTHSGGPDFAYDLCTRKIPATEVSRLSLSSWKVAYNGSEPVNANTMRAFARHFALAGFDKAAFTPCYGMAEATLLVTANRSAEPKVIYLSNDHNDITCKLVAENETWSRQMVSCGTPPSGVSVRVLSLTDTTECNELVEGEICIHGGNVMNGYWKQATNKFIDIDNLKYFRTGDAGLLFDGELYIRGRLNDMIVYHGENYHLKDIEDGIHEQLSDGEVGTVACFMTGVSPQELVALIEIPVRHPDQQYIAAILTTAYTVVSGRFGITPQNIALVMPHSIPKTTSGKIRRDACEKEYQQDTLKIMASLKDIAISNTGSDGNALLDAVIKNADYHNIRIYIINAITRINGGITVSLQDDETTLSELGMDSIKAMELMNLINKDLGASLESSALFYSKPLSELIRMIEYTLWLKNPIQQRKEIVL
jgi:acyl-CoA synthetase (AMP-forming)/AMP-acid ligase II/acyl carrier protein